MCLLHKVIVLSLPSRSLSSRTNIEIGHGNAQHHAQLAVTAFRAYSDSTPWGGLPSPLQPTAVAFTSLPESVSLIVYPQLWHEAYPAL